MQELPWPCLTTHHYQKVHCTGIWTCGKRPGSQREASVHIWCGWKYDMPGGCSEILSADRWRMVHDVALQWEIGNGRGRGNPFKDICTLTPGVRVWVAIYKSLQFPIPLGPIPIPLEPTLGSLLNVGRESTLACEHWTWFWLVWVATLNIWRSVQLLLLLNMTCKYFIPAWHNCASFLTSATDI